MKKAVEEVNLEETSNTSTQIILGCAQVIFNFQRKWKFKNPEYKIDKKVRESFFFKIITKIYKIHYMDHRRFCSKFSLE